MGKSEVKDNRPFGCHKCYGSGLIDMEPCDCKAGDGWKVDLGEPDAYYIDFWSCKGLFLRYTWYCGGCTLELREEGVIGDSGVPISSLKSALDFQNLKQIRGLGKFKAICGLCEAWARKHRKFREWETALHQFLTGGVEPKHPLYAKH